ncbi:MAG: B12-binding domain-containing radical SAM protein [Nitrospirae bacterium]|nr:B12-binding domain-containing radical SAM protein [Nitrospirota bacterium]
MAKVLFVDVEQRNEKLGIMYISAALKKSGHDTMLCWFDKEDVDSIVRSFSPDFLAFTLTTGIHRRLIKIATTLKKQHGLKIIMGGPHITFFSDNIPENVADFLVIGQGESVVSSIVEGKITDRIIKSDLIDINTLSFPDRALFYRFKEFRDNPMKNIITMRDCPYSCSYCYNHSWKKMFKGQPYFLQRRTVDNVIEEIKVIKERFILEKILFIDDNFIVNEKWVREFSEKYKKEVNLPFICSMRVNLLNEEKLQTLKEAGLFMVNFALECADPFVQKNILNRGYINNEHVIDAISMLKKHNIKSRMQNMIGLPLDDSLKDALNTLSFNQKNQVEDSWVSIFQPYPNTKLAKYCIDNGFIEGDLEKNIADSFFDKSSIKIDHKDEINRLQKWWYYIVRYNFSDNFVRQLLTIDIDDSIAQKLQDLRFDFSKRYLYDIVEENSNSLSFNLDQIYNEFKSSTNFSLWQNIIIKYKIPIALVNILINLNVPKDMFNNLSE